MAASLVMIFIPPRFTEGLKGLAQLFAPFQSPVYRTAQAAAAGMRNWVRSSDVTFAVDPVQIAALERQLVRVTEDNQFLRRENSAIRGLRDYIPPGVTIMPARVIAQDITARRDALLLSRGAGLPGDNKPSVQPYDSVASRHLKINMGDVHGTQVDHLVIAREFLLGYIDQVAPWTSRVRLFSDPGSIWEVRIGRIAGTGGPNDPVRYAEIDYPCSLYGDGGGRMLIKDVPVRYVDLKSDNLPGTMRIGDVVISPSARREMATPLVIGRITGFEEDLQKRLVVTVHVESPVPPDEIRDVFIIASSPRQS
jgi:hypothetical protein